jgi:DNA-binding SARP family transcriptional activator
MTALYRSGRQADALEAYQDARRALVDGLGIEPGVALQKLERAILGQDPSLDLEVPARAAAAAVAERSILVAILDETRAEELLAVADPSCAVRRAS